jgi:hypothetical protein
MLRAHDDLPGVDYFLYMDSDAIVSFQFGDLPLNARFANMTQKLLNWNVFEKSVVFNQDGECWWCNGLLKNSSYTKACLNTGTVAWYRSDRAKQKCYRSGGNRRWTLLSTTRLEFSSERSGHGNKNATWPCITIHTIKTATMFLAIFNWHLNRNDSIWSKTRTGAFLICKRPTVLFLTTVLTKKTSN